ncbi:MULTISPECIES: TolC family protein [Myxococcus]|uniref:Transporter n=1 Tax=Myxococcus xanthus TaxID=34 RepID=A0AAE6G1H5_MYXXA|nr:MULTISPECIES: TolC family protein [Myxococcus]QDE69169.1 transporter [Myxococcus xanthus]QDE76445.1 transporter [Myxococcus xanthus]QDE83869.1 transporter [Myxococcus xanthus]QDE98014.1 transporter [Myxococcus xanthus]QDF05717.1 transporter [Myxococcus xanthus]
MNALVVAAALAAVPVDSGTPITLDQARAEGRQNVAAIQSLLDVAMADEDVKLSRAALLPQISVDASAGKIWFGRRQEFITVPDPANPGGFVRNAVETPSTSTQNYDLGMSLTQIIYDRARWKQLEQSGVVRDAQKGQAREEADTSELEAIRRFFTLYRSQATLNVLKATVQRSEEQVERAQALFHAGRTGKNEEITAAVNLGTDRINYTAMLGQLVNDQTQLAVWLARPGTDVLTASDPGVLTTEPLPAPSVNEALSSARAYRPLLKTLELRIRAAELRQSIARSEYLPRLVAQGLYNRGGPDASLVFTEPRLQNRFTAAVGLSWDIFTGLSTGASSRRAEADIRKAQLTLEQTAREIEGEVRAAHRTLEAKLEAARLAAQNVEAAVQGLDMQEARFRAGAGSTLEVRDAQLSLTRAELALLENRIDVEIARYSLLRAMGALSPGESK